MNEEARSFAFWTTYGLLAGATLGAAEVVVALLGGEFGSAVPILFFLATDLAIGVLLGAMLWSGRRLLQIRNEPDFAATLVPLATGVSFLFLANQAAQAAAFRGFSPLLGVAILVAGLAACSTPALLGIRRFVQRPPTPDALTVSLSFVCLWLVLGHDLTKRVFTSYSSSEGLLANLVFLVVLLSCLFGQLRILRRRPARQGQTGYLIGRPHLLVLLVPLLAVSTHDGLHLIGNRMENLGGERSGRGSTNREPEARPNIILITLDTLRADRVIDPESGRILMESLRDFAEGATVYAHAVSPSSWTLPAHASMFTGLWPNEHRTDVLTISGEGEPFRMGSASPLPEDRTTVAELLRRAGYETAAFVANYGMLDHRLGVGQGFDTYEDAARISWGSRPFLDAWIWKVQPLWYLRLTKPYRMADEIVGAAEKWLDERDPGRRFFLFVNLLDPHSPYAPPPSQTPELARRLRPRPNPRKVVMTGARSPSEVERDYFTALYAGEVAFLDRELARLLRGLEARGLLDGSLVVITADHGEFFGEHGLWGHGYGPYEEVHHVPLMIRYPDGPLPEVVSDTVSLVDLFEVLSGAARQKSRIPHLRVRADLDRPALIEQFVDADLVIAFGDRFARGYCGAVSFPWKLVEYTDAETALFRLTNEDGESEDVSEQYPEIAARLASSTSDCVKAMASSYGPGAAGRIDPETIQRLRALGYVN